MHQNRKNGQNNATSWFNGDNFIVLHPAASSKIAEYCVFRKTFRYESITCFFRIQVSVIREKRKIPAVFKSMVSLASFMLQFRFLFTKPQYFA